MKYLIASDIHGSAYWCGRLMERVEAERPDKILILGDVLYHGPRNALPRDYDPKGVIAMLNPLAPAIVAVRGNCEAEVDQMVLDFPCMADYAEIVDPGGRTLWLTHGHLWNPGNLPPLQPGSAFLYGHTHVKVLEEVEGGVTVFNPGSVSIPKDGSHSFGIYEDGRFRLELLEEG
ncbi:phosphodiesterase [Olsenella sp. CU969]|uniref:phosphodiesterase n=1 Tax=Olsenella sp. CU969 TaxID=2780101 RepID=UPI001958B3B9|nr:phosphodiesterase [Olsenella sp. CU969]MBF0598793.1 phosphodiesterase [Atopobiaceae bacterium FL090493]